LYFCAVKNLHLSVPCSLMVYQHYKHSGFDNYFYAVLKALCAKQFEPGTETNESFKCHLSVPVSLDMMYRHGLVFDHDLNLVLNRVLENHIKQKILTSFEIAIDLARQNRCRFSIKQTIEICLNNMGLNEDGFSFETAKKMIQRHCLKNNINYKDVKSIGSFVPRKVNIEEGDKISLNDYLIKHKISKQAYYRYHHRRLATCKEHGRLYIIVK